MPRRQSRPLRRRAGDREERQRFLVYCEGRVTESTYFKGIRAELRSNGITVKLGNSHGVPLSLVEDAVEHQCRAPRSREDGFESYDQVWCVLDVEAPHPHPRLDDALRLARKHGVRCAVSNPCFELWLLLHLDESRAYLTTEQACRLLEGSGCGYTRAGKDFRYEDLRALREVAVERARALSNRWNSESDVRKRNPWTSVWELVDELTRRA